MTVRSSILACACAAALLCARADAGDIADIGDLSIEQLMDLSIESVTGASRYEQRVTQAPSSISVVTANDIRRFGYTSFPDVLRSVRGLFVTDDRNYTYLGIRGFHRPGDYNTRVLVLIDGHRLNDNIYDSGSIARDAMIDVDLIERVEVIRGPSSSVYGSSAFLAVINVVTKQGRDIDGAEFAADAGSLDTYRTRATFGARTERGIDWVASAAHFASSGAERLYYPEFDQRISDNPLARNNGLAIGLDDEEAAKFFTSLRAGNFSASAYFSERSKQVPTASFETMFADPNNRTNDQRGYVDLSLHGEIRSGLHYRAHAFYDHYEYRGSLPYNWADVGDAPDVVLYRDSALGEWIGGEFHLTTTLASNYTVVVGTEYRANLRERQTAYDDFDPRLYYLDKGSSSAVFGVFAQTEATLHERFRVTGGLRYDRYSHGFGSTVNPRIAAIYNASERSAVKILYGEAFRAPNPYERYYFYAEQQRHTELQPETIRTYEAVYEHYFDAQYRLNVSAYQYDIDGLITQTANEGERYFANVDSVTARGIEFGVEARWPSGFLARGSYALQRSKDETTGLELTSSPHQIGKLNLSMPILHTGMLSSLELQYQSNSITLSRAHASDFLLTNATFTSHELWKNIELTAGIYNAFDVKHAYPAAEEHAQDVIALNGRTYQGKVVVRF